jgi:hypothetical protein
MFHASVQKFDLTKNLKILAKFLASKRCQPLRSECRAGVVRPEFEFERNRTGEGSGNGAGLREHWNRSCEFVGLVGLFVCRAELAAWWSYLTR